MKITVVKKAVKNAKPSGFCTTVILDPGGQKRT
jgi:hypothetical protein